jgi:hypothetical protein
LTGGGAVLQWALKRTGQNFLAAKIQLVRLLLALLLSWVGHVRLLNAKCWH